MRKEFFPPVFRFPFWPFWISICQEAFKLQKDNPSFPHLILLEQRVYEEFCFLLLHQATNFVMLLEENLRWILDYCGEAARKIFCIRFCASWFNAALQDIFST